MSSSFSIITSLICIGFVNALSIECDEEFSCSNLTYTPSTTIVQAYGYKSAYQMAVELQFHSMHCNGAFSCAESGFRQQTGDCAGSNACNGATIHGANEEIAFFVHCYGESSCANTKMSVSADDSIDHWGVLDCDGAYSCMNAEIHSMESIRADGAFALYNARITSTDSMKVFLDGYKAAYNTTIICPTGHACSISINCGNGACVGLNMQCDGECDLWSLDDFDLPMDETLDPFALFYNVSTAHNEMCDDNPIYAFDSSNELNTTFIGSNNAPICCRADSACGDYPGSGHDIYQYSSQYPVVCSGDISCGQSTIVSAGDVSCSGWNSCMNATIDVDGSLYCLGTGSCYKAIVSGPNNVYCMGSNSCPSEITSTGDMNVYVLDSSEKAIINCADGYQCFIKCDEQLYCEELITCNGDCVFEDWTDDSGSISMSFVGVLLLLQSVLFFV